MSDDASRRITRFIEPFRVSPGSKVNLAKDFDPAFQAGIKKKEDGVTLLDEGVELLAKYQARLAAQDTYGVLVVLQALDAAGKDGTIRHVMSGVNPQGVRVESFKVPSALELDQDFLRRYQQRLPSRGEIGIFNRSHYEEVLVVRVHPEILLRQQLPAETREHHVWKRRYEAINEWEGTVKLLSGAAEADDLGVDRQPEGPSWARCRTRVTGIRRRSSRTACGCITGSR